MTALGWQNFYVIVGSSAGALIGLQFVAITLVADRSHGPNQQLAGAAFGTPTIVHFCMALAISALLTAPWHALLGPAILWGLLGLTGFVYEIIVVRRMLIQTTYKPQLEDWMFHALLPFVAYGILAASAWEAAARPGESLCAVAVAALLLLFIGIHNAWDAVTYHVFVVAQRPNNPEKKS
jgi:hypothetical protein